jgi:hypothetical protein
VPAVLSTFAPSTARSTGHPAAPLTAAPLQASNGSTSAATATASGQAELPTRTTSETPLGLLLATT